MMELNTIRSNNCLRNTRGGAAGIVIVLVLILGAVAGGGYWAYNKFLKEKPPRTKLSTLKAKEELVQFAHDRMSRALHANMIIVDDFVVMLDKEVKRLKSIGKKFPDQSNIIEPQVKALTAARESLASALEAVYATIEKTYVTWLVDRVRGIKQIKAQKGTLAQQLADVVREHAELIRSIRKNVAS
ncbi:MAG: hypothetical protein CR984_05800 [Proteobacteria bacterium]|nr:MAG: hypothetical protein CR984_05800 [Pseudomonadota bacterium]